MVVLNKIYTRTGDQGETSLGDGMRVNKTHELVEAYGTVDELNSMIGFARIEAEGDMNAQLERIQNELFDLGADLSRPLQADEGNVLRIISSQVEHLEQEIDAMNANLAALKSFILPGGSELSARLHLSRTLARRAERAVLRVEQAVNIETIRYLNRLSDWLFVAARVANQNGEADVLWQPGASR